ncbi:MAG: DUF4349 domain-containing protein [Altererythrobacter sp.]|nr:DUF4349 domain-containing protein [Altererythrobacter sp.]
MFSTACAIALSACSQAGDQTTASEILAQPSESRVTADASSAPGEPFLTAPLPTALPKLAYVYGLVFESSAPDVGRLMRRHADICEQRGPASCRIVGMDLSEDEQSNDVGGKLTLAVAAPYARALAALLEKEAEGMGAEQTSTTIASEEVSKVLVDTDARIRAREELRDRLTEVLRTRQGSVKELVEAERQVAAVNEEIDQAKSWLAETRGRVSFSRMDIDYRSQASAGASFSAPIATALGSLGSVVGFVIAALLMLAAVLGPIAGTVWAVRRINRRFTAGEAEA